MVSIQFTVPEEIALEGLDGITLDTLWFRMSERMQMPLPLSNRLRSEVWKLVLSRTCFELFEIDQDRPTPKRLDRRDFFFNKELSKEEVTKYMNATYFIYSFCPVDDPLIRGSCTEFKTRKKIDKCAIKDLTLEEVHAQYHNKLVIVASQGLRNSVLIPKNNSCDTDINEHAYAILERIGRQREFGEATSGPFSIFEFVKDSKLLHYFRSTLLRNNLVVRQQFQMNLRGQKISGQLFHLPRFYILLGSSSMLMTEQILTFLKSRPNQIAEVVKIRDMLNVKQKHLISFIKARSNIFKHETNTYYRECYPEAKEKEFMLKNKAKGEKTLSTIKLIDPDFDAQTLWRVDDDDNQGDDKGFIDISNQKANKPLVYQVCEKIRESGKEGMSQNEIGNHFGLTRLNARAVLRKLQRTRGVKFYLQDVGRQRVSRFITGDVAGDAQQNYVKEIQKLQIKAEEVAFPQPMTTKTEKTSPTKISIPLSASMLKCFKPEPQGQSSVIQFVTPTDDTQDDKEEAIVDESVVVPATEESFIDNLENIAVSIKYLNNVPTVQKQCRGIADEMNQNRLSQKVLTRMNAILDIIKTQTVVDSITLLNLMRQKEENLPECICRKSMLSLCGKLAADNFLKVVEIDMVSENKTVKLIYFVEPTLSHTDGDSWKPIIEEQKIQHFFSLNRTGFNTDAGSNILTSMRPKIKKASTSTEAGDFGAQSKRVDNFPKFMKLKLFHEFLYYLIYSYPKNQKAIPIKKGIEAWTKENPKIAEYGDITEKISNCFSLEIGWKMFVAPLTPQPGFGTGWGFLRDIIHRLPLIIFAKFTRFIQGSKELEMYLNHPIKCNFLLHALPVHLRVELLQKRKHIAVILDLVRKLCWLGLLQMGPSRAKETDHIFIYLNRYTVLLDTHTSEDGYFEVSDKEYQELKFNLDSAETVSEFWNQMFHIATNTRLNRKRVIVGPVPDLEQLSLKPALQEALKVQTPALAPLNDVGYVPGDRKGAAGIDSSFLVHLKRSWMRPLDRVKKTRSRAVASAIRFKDGTKKIKKTKTSGAKAAAAKIKSKSLNAAQAKFKRVSRKSSATLVHLARRQTLKLQDEIDKEALKMMKTSRVMWSELEDKTLILTKVAMKFAFSQAPQSAHYINGYYIRDILHWCTSVSLNKTSKACTRRLHYLIKMKPSVKETIALYHEELKTNPEFVAKYKNLPDRLKKIYRLENVYEAVKIHFVEMIHKMHQIFYKQFLSDQFEGREEHSYDLPKNYEKIVEKYKITNPADSLVAQNYFEPKTTHEAETSMLMSSVHSAVCCVHDKTSSSFELISVFNKFSDVSLTLAVNQLKRANVISGNKKENYKNKSFLPYSFPQFHLSPKYSTQIMSIHVPVELYSEYLKAVKSVSDSDGPHQIRTTNCGWIFLLAEMMSNGKIILSHDDLDKLVMIDPALRQKSAFEKISDDYLKLKTDQENRVKQKKTVKFSPDEVIEETFMFSEDPVEAFFRIDQIYLHAFCLIRELGSAPEVQSKSFKISKEDGGCTFDNCVLTNDMTFGETALHIACQEREIVRHIMMSAGLDNADPSVVTKENFVTFFDGFIEKYQQEFDAENRKDLCGKGLTKWKKITARKLVRYIFLLSTNPGLEEDCWLSDYKKISSKAEDEGIDDEDLDTTVDYIKHSKMLNQLKDLNLTSRTSDSFVVNLSTIYVDIKNPSGEQAKFVENDLKVEMMPFKEETQTKFVEKILSEIKFVPSDFTTKELLPALEASGVDGTLELVQISDICTFLQSKGSMGITAKELLAIYKDKERLQKQIELLMRLKFVQRVGTVEIRFVHYSFAHYWYLDSFFMKREVDGNLPALIKESEPKRQTSSVEHEGPPTKKVKLDDVAGPSTAPVIPLETLAPVTTEIEAIKPPLIRHPIRVRPSPWVRINGTLNRRVLDKWLGTILNHLMLNPCMMITELYQKFNMLTPFNIRNLCEILEMIGSVKMMTVTEPEADFFSVYEGSTSAPATFFCSCDQIFIEVTNNSAQCLAFFIGKQKYKVPFI